MGINKLPLEEVSIGKLYNSAHAATYEVPIYQRNYAWEKDEISTLIQDVYDAYKKGCHNHSPSVYYIGTLVTYDRGERVCEVIDGQQRLTTINLILGALGVSTQNKLTFRARKKSNDTIRSIPHFDIDEKDNGIVNGFKYVKDSLRNTVLDFETEAFRNFFLENVHIIHYRVPRDIDLNHYFEVMNSRGEQLEKHEIIKARLISALNTGTTTSEKEKSSQDRIKFSTIWESCSEMNVYIQQKCPKTNAFGTDLSKFSAVSFDDIAFPEQKNQEQELTIAQLIENNGAGTELKKEVESNPDTFQPIINFSNFLLIVLKLTRILTKKTFNPKDFNLDDKELITEFDKIPLDAQWVKEFGYNLIRARYYLDNYIVHHSNEDDTIDSNPWMLQKWQTDGKKGYPKNLADGKTEVQQKLVQLLSMFEVSFTARQRKNYLFYCLLYLFQQEKNEPDVSQYCDFVENLAKKYFRDIYMDRACLNSINTPVPGAFDEVILSNGKPVVSIENKDNNFEKIYGNGTDASKGIPLFVFNYLDYRIWLSYTENLRGEKLKEGSKERKCFFDML